MIRNFIQPPDSIKRRPKTAGEVIIENLQKDGDDIVGIEVDGEKWPVEKICRRDECHYCMNCPMHLALQLQEVGAFYGQCELMVCLEIEGCPLASVLIDEFLDPRQNTQEELPVMNSLMVLWF